MTNTGLLILTSLCIVFALCAETDVLVSRGVPSQPVKAVEGGAVTLQCPLVPGVNLSACTVDVSRDDPNVSNDIVHVYRKGKDYPPEQMAEYKSRTTLIHEDLTKGILTLIISPVQLSDRGRYRVHVPNLTVSCFIDVIVGPKVPQNRTKRGDSSTTIPPVEGVTKSDHGDAAKVEPLWKTVLPIVFGCVAAAAAFVSIVVLILVKRGKIQNCGRTTRGRGEQEAQMRNDTELSPLRTSRQDDQNHDGPGDNLQVVVMA